MQPQLRTIFDTNTFELLYKEDLLDILAIIDNGKIVVYGCKIIRDELRQIPKTVTSQGRSLRNSLLIVYDTITKNRSYPIEKIVETLAEEYWKEFEGGTPKRKIMPDFIIVALATIHNLDVIVSEDDKTMKSQTAIKSYKSVNQKNGFNTPNFYSLKEIKALF